MRLKQAEADVLAKQTAAIHAERRRLALLPPSERRSTLIAPKAEAKAMPATLQPMALVPAGATVSAPIVTAPRLTPEQVRQSWW